jgi:hypothetical protein
MQPADLGEDLVRVRTYLCHQLAGPAHIGVSVVEVQLFGMLQDRAVLWRELGQRPVRGGVLRSDLTGGEGGPAASKGQQDVASVVV